MKFEQYAQKVDVIATVFHILWHEKCEVKPFSLRLTCQC